ncbi:MAG TPA: metal-dependent transcriptional regulator [Flexistipes sinusarabici]|uniref:Transcriptional regulator MntR n=2 Tax=Flexistipes sinusarabici TaxID=2352 RepID=A0A3D5QAL9_FLESI|nr:metal-dependent transcriptional regulator [Flexistipes sinusarabici]
MQNRKLSTSMEDYLETIFILQNEGKSARSKDISEKLSVKKSSVTNALQLLSEGGYINYNKYSEVTLTDKGMKYAREVYKRHETIKEFFEHVLQVDSELAEENACKIEHVIDKKVFDKLSCFLEFIMQSDITCVNIEKFRQVCDKN